MSASTNSAEPGFTPSGCTAGVNLARVFAAPHERRVIVACFASHVHRVQQVVDAAVASGRRVATLGRSMGKNVELAVRLGILSMPEGTLVDIDEIDRLSDGQV